MQSAGASNATTAPMTAAPIAAAASTAPAIDISPDRVVSGKRISPPEAQQIVGNLPMNLILTPGGKYALSTDMGAQELLSVVRTKDGTGVSSVEFSNRTQRRQREDENGEAALPPNSPPGPRSNGLYYGLAASADGTVYAAMGAHDSIGVLTLDPSGTLKKINEIQTSRHDFPAGLALDGRGLLFVVNNTSNEHDPFRSPGSVSIYDPNADAHAGKQIGHVELPNRFQNTSGFPMGICVLKDGSKAYVTSERDGSAYAIDAVDPVHPKVVATIDTGAKPLGITVSADQKYVYVANGQSDNVSIIDTHTDQVIGTANLRPEQARGVPGTTPLSVALSPDQKTLYVALADMNAIGVVNVSDPTAPVLSGYLSTGWYPSAVVAAPDGKHLLVTDARGSSALNPNGKLASTQPGDRRSYILNVIHGDVRLITLPDADGLKAATEKVLAQNSLPAPHRDSDDHIAATGLKAGKIQHVFYIIKENRTYDQVLGDEPAGNGDKSLLLFGRDITPNLHAIAERFVLLDNTYCCGEVSGDGWNWSTQGMASAYVSRNVPYNYSGRGRPFDFEGENNGYPTAGIPTTGPGSVATTGPVLSQGGEAVPDVGAAPDHIWDNARRAGLTLRNYGFYVSAAEVSGRNVGLPGAPLNYPTVTGLRPGGHDLDGITDVDYHGFELTYADSNAGVNLSKRFLNPDLFYSIRTYGQAKSPSRFAEWKREFDLMLKKDPTGASVPQLNLLRMGNDHTAGMRRGNHTPRSMVADNDYAIGEVVEAISNSPIWNSSAIFVIEDDAQAGEDHVDAHRTTCFVISPWIKAHSVDHRFYNTDSVLRTMELLLGLPPMTQYEAIAAGIDDFDESPSNAEPFKAILPSVDLVSDVAPEPDNFGLADPMRQMIELSDRMDFSHADAAPTELLNEVVWKSVHGPHSAAPARRVSNTLAPSAKHRDGDRDGDNDGD
jgi:YVTN family beta-propeller protein